MDTTSYRNKVSKLSWTKINELYAGICHCSKCTREYFGRNEATHETRSAEAKSANTLQHMFLPISFEEIVSR